MTEKQIKRFWSKVKKTRGCWWWVGAKFSNGYGRFWASKEYLAHRVSWELHNGPIPEGLHVLHRCDNPSCVRPDHLSVGTHKENMRDMVNKGRSSHSTGTNGENHYRSKITAKDVKEIREKYSNSKTPLKIIAQEFGLSKIHINKILLRKIWKHI